MSGGSLSQLRGLFSLRWRMIRSDGIRAALIIAVLVVVWLAFLVASGAHALDDIRAATAIELAPQAFLGFGVLALIAPLTTGGGNEVVPSSQLVAYPVRARTVFLGGLALAPVNLVWVLQILALVAETTLLSLKGQLLAPALTTAVYVAALTALGQATAWLVVGLRQTRRGRQGVAFAGTGLLLTAVIVIRAGALNDVLAYSPTRSVVRGVSAGADGRTGQWLTVTLSLVALTVAALWLGERTCAWALRRPGDVGASRSSRDVRRRPSHHSPLRTLIAMDRASVWRAPALRRGGLVLAFLPALAAAGAQVPWASMMVLPGLIAAGAGLLFGINAFCLDGSGSIFLASQPNDPVLQARAKAIVLAETVFGAVVIAAIGGSLRSPGSPTGLQVVGIVLSALACTATVVALGMSTSVRRPHRADLNGPRDAVAPPGALTAASVRLAMPAAFLGFAIEQSTRSGVWWASSAIAVPVLGLCAWSLSRSLKLWSQPLVRARIVQVVSAG